MSFHHFFWGFVSPNWCNEASILCKTVRVICTRVWMNPRVDEMSMLQTIHNYSRDLCAVSRPFDLLIVLKIPRLHAKWMREMKQFVHQFGCWQSFSAINGVVSFSPEFLEKTMEGERERERRHAPERSRKHCHGNQGQAAESFIQTCSNLCWTPSCVSPSHPCPWRPFDAQT